jgi:chemotaxis signal transduction protein
MKERTAVDWDGIRLRFEKARAAFARVSAREPERVRNAYRRRAKQMAQPLDTGGRLETLQVLVFRVGDGRYGIELAHLSEVIPHPLCAPVPGAPPELAGVLQVRGEIHAVWELSRVLGLPDVAPDDSGSVLLLRTGSRDIGIKVSAVEEIREFATEECAPPPGGSPHTKWITADSIAILDPAAKAFRPAGPPDFES